jgi:hypothetical protein
LPFVHRAWGPLQRTPIETQNNIVANNLATNSITQQKLNKKKPGFLLIFKNLDHLVSSNSEKSMLQEKVTGT